MSLEIPLTYRLDIGRDITCALQEDTFTTIIDIDEAFSQTELNRVVNSAGELLVSNVTTLDEVHRLYVFTSSALTIAAAFEHSDAPEPVRLRTLKAVGLRSMPISLLSDDSDEILRAFEEVAKQGHRNHPEMRDAVNTLLEFHMAISREGLIARSAFCGAGFMIYQLDRAWDRVRALEIDTACQAEAGFDWDSIW